MKINELVNKFEWIRRFLWNRLWLRSRLLPMPHHRWRNPSLQCPFPASGKPGRPPWQSPWWRWQKEWCTGALCYQHSPAWNSWKKNQLLMVQDCETFDISDDIQRRLSGRSKIWLTPFQCRSHKPVIFRSSSTNWEEERDQPKMF